MRSNLKDRKTLLRSTGPQNEAHVGTAVPK